MPVQIDLIRALKGLAYDINLMIDNKRSPDEIKSFCFMRIANMQRDYEYHVKFNSTEYRREHSKAKYNIHNYVKVEQ